MTASLSFDSTGPAFAQTVVFRPASYGDVDTPWLLRVLRRSGDFRVPEPLQECEVPTSIAVGAREAGADRSAELLASHFSAASVVEVPSAGPGWYSMPQRLLTYTLSWLGDVDAATPRDHALAPRSTGRRPSHLSLVP